VNADAQFADVNIGGRRPK